MKRCPTCQRTYEDNMKFCQADGTILVEDVPSSGADDPFKTVLANPPSSQQQEPEPEESDFDPMKTMLAAPPTLDAPPPSPFGEQPRRDEPKDTGMNAPSFGDLGSPKFNESPLPSESYPKEQRDSGGFGQQQPSGQFGQQPSGQFGNEPTFKEPESPFGNQPKFGGEPFGNQPNEWTAPPAPQGWGNQGLGQNTPFNAPPIKSDSSGGTPMIMGIISLILGLISFPAMCICYLNFITAPIGTILGAIAFFGARSNPLAKNAMWLGIAGIALNILSIIAVIVLIIVGVGLGTIGNLPR